ncbi:hypothetical protein C8J57DRAFT_42388 [Mycena rebaudengoi]|nr:hypothetical protein C8J57DRAFT_42388 [Mycena rebaudengoi]
MQRPIVSYDDITLPYAPAASAVPGAARSSGEGGSAHKNASHQPPVKKRKWSSNQKQKQKQVSTARTEEKYEDEDAEDEEDEGVDGASMSRYLTSEEAWDDSALIDAWNAATEEYEAFHGPDKGWKKDPVHKSPLWYNVPPEKPPPRKKVKLEDGAAPAEEEEADSRPLDFNTFVPAHDPSLALPRPNVSTNRTFGENLGINTGAGAGMGMGAAPGMPTQDEAFERALSAMYWGGYWTAVYYCQRGEHPPDAAAEGDGDEAEMGDDDGEDAYEEGAQEEEDLEEEADFIPTQR